MAAERGKPDAELAHQLSDFELTERLSSTTLARLETHSPGVKSSQELRLLADQSAFLPLPAAEIPANPTPDIATQRQMLALVVNYVGKTIHQLPNFYASRLTTHFEETPQRPGRIGTAAIEYVPLHETNAYQATVLYRNGEEIVDDGKVLTKASTGQEKGLRDWGVFGAILSTVLLDAARSDLSWSHWEQAGATTQAVFRYAVPEAKSHYQVTYCCVPGLDPTSDPMRRFDRVVGYHGEIAVDPQQGSILRLTVEADLKSTEPVLMANIMVEYDSVEIGGQTYICPTRSVSFSQALSANSFVGDPRHGGMVTPGPPQKLLNDVAFVQYHMFRSDVRLASGDDAAAPSAEQAANATAAPQEPEHGTEPAPPTTPVAAATEATQPLTEQPLFKTTTRDVVVDVVVTKHDGAPVPGLTKEDFTISENGKPQVIDFFEEHTQSSLASGAPTEMPAMPPDARTNIPSTPPAAVVNVLLIDTLNTQVQDQAYVRRQVMDFLAKLQPSTRMAIFVLGSQLRYLQGFTSDSSALLAALRDPRNGLNGEKNMALKTSGDQATDAAGLATLQTMQTSMQAIDALQSALADAGSRDAGQRARMTLEALTYLGYYLAGVPGRKNLIWFAGSFPVAIFPNADQLARLKRNPTLAAYVSRTKTIADLFTVSKIAVYPISAEGLMTEHIGEADIAGPGSPGGVGHMGSQTQSVMSPYDEGANERAATIEAMEQLAASTGGKAYYNGNDLGAALNRAINDGANYYTIGYHPADKMDGSYRQIAVKLTHGKGNLAYRHGYNADDTPAQEAKSGGDPLAPLLRLGLPGAAGVLYGVGAEPAAVQPSSGEARAGQNANLQDPVTRYTVNFVIRAQDVALNPNSQGGKSGKLLLGVKAFDRAGNALNWAGDVEMLDMTPDQYDSLRANGIHAHLDIDLPPVDGIQLVTAVYDFDSGQAGTLQIPLKAPARSSK